MSTPKLDYQINPIILVGGIAGQIPGGMIPLLSMFTTGATTSLGLPFDIGDLDDAFGAFNILPGGTLISNSIAKYPFANQSVAANAIIREPLTLSVIMDAPMRGVNAWNVKRMIFTTLKMTLDSHNDAGGMYTVYTPAFQYDNLVMVSLTDNSRGNNSLPQNAWRFDFERPLVALTDLVGAWNQFMQKIGNQLPTPGNISGSSPGFTSGNAILAQTIKTGGGLTGGTPPPVQVPSSPGVLNYPVSPNPASFPYGGIS
jgi:hypothetical protein